MRLTGARAHRHCTTHQVSPPSLRPDTGLIAGPRHLQTVLDEYVAHYNRRRPHRARSLRPPDGGDIITAPVTGLATARIRRREVLSGLIHEYERAA